ncbi:MAG: hypothetical protein H3C36_14405, partial [Chitinophagaceae bacterium]|nr:hypothetical protein [Chitinophagaceae bacterium]
MKSVLDISVSAFSNYHSTSPKDVNLLTWLYSDKYADKVLAIRELSDKKERDKIKATLPAVTPGGTFSERRATGLINHSGLLQFDVDGVQDIKTTKQKICSLPNVAYCGLSVSGRGLWGLIPIVEPAHHKQYFEFIQKAFASMGIIIDESCKDVSR